MRPPPGPADLRALSCAWLATGLFGARMLTSPPVSEAATNPGIDVGQIALNAPKDLPSFDDKYQMYTGVLDTLRR